MKVGKLLLGAREGVHLNTGQRRVRIVIPSSHHDPVLELYGTSPAENEDDISIHIHSD